MAVRASDLVTLAVLPSPSYVRLYYQLKASGSAAPAKPTTNPPASPWTTIEPTYSEGSTNTLYTVMLTAYGSVAFEYGDVQKSSAYEASKIAYNKAANAETQAQQAKSESAQAILRANQSVKNSVVQYAVSSSRSAAPSSGWSTTQPSPSAGQYVWMRTQVTYGDDTSAYTAAALITGNDGAKGETGAKGNDGAKGDQGISISSVTPYFRAATSKPAQPSGASPAGWSTAEPAPGASDYMWRAERVVLSNSTYQWTPVTRVESFEVAREAKDIADSAMLMAGSKNAVYYSTSAASGTTAREGDTWRQRDSSNNIIAEWRWSGTAWVKQELSSAVISSLDVGKLTAGAANIATVVAQKIAAASAQFIELDVKQLRVTGSGDMNQAVIDKLWADVVRSRKITTDMLLVGSGENLSWDGTYLLWDQPGMYRSIDAGPGSGWTTENVRKGLARVQKLTEKTAGTATMSLYASHPNGMTGASPSEPGRPLWVGDRVGSAVVAYGYFYVSKAPPTGMTSISTRIYGYNAAGSLQLNANGGSISRANITPGTWLRVGGSRVTIPAGVTHVFVRPTVYYTNSTTAVNGTEYFIGGTELYWADAASLIVDGGILARHVATAAIVAEKIASNAVTAAKIAADAVTAAKIKAGEIKAQHLDVVAEENNRRLTIQPDGIRMWGNVAAGGDPNISITTEGVEYFSISDNEGNTLSSMDEDGNVTGKIVSANEDMEIAGESVSQLIEDAAQGLIARYERPFSGVKLNANANTDGRLEILELETSLRGGRVYELRIDPMAWQVPTDSYVYLYTHYTIDGTTPTRTNRAGFLTLAYLRNRANQTGNSVMPLYGARLYMPDTDIERFRVLLEIRHATTVAALRSITSSTLSGMNSARLSIIDLGTKSFGDEGVDRTKIEEPTTDTGGASSGGGGDPAPVKTYTKTYNSTSGYTFDPRNNSRITTYTYANNVAQGGGSLGPYGELYGGWFFGNAWASDISGAEVTKVELYLTNLHAYSNAGLTAMIHSHTSTATNPSSMARSALTSRTSSAFSKGQGKWVDVTASMKTLMGTVKGFGINTSGNANYGYFSQSAKVRITYKK